MEEDHYHRARRLIFNHSGFRVAGRTQLMPGELFYELLSDHGRLRGPPPMVKVENMNYHEQRIVSAGSHFPAHTLLDMEPMIVPDAMDYFDPRTIFRETNSGLLVPEDTVPDLLERIQALQEPARQEWLREQVRQRARDEGTSMISAQIIQFGRAA